ncbi:LysR family transcriptional regulator [Halalkalibacter sp. AB-rgal2]|uniref:LysR family transcriptional regulator n=1 Tax=Halalkalibacter sp. AB-rgal2 TaxID=3242695 RepID=UPI00359D77A5
MEIKQLITFIDASESLNFTKTAKKLNFAQSSVTAQIKTLEKELGSPLFERLGKRIILTEAGELFKDYAENIVTLSHQAKIVVENHSKVSGTLIIGAQESQCTYRLPPILKTFKKSFPQVRMVFKPVHSNEAGREDLIHGKLDIAFIMDSLIENENFTIMPLIKEDLVLVASPEHQIAQKEYVTPEDLAKETLLLTETGCSYRSALEDFFSLSKLDPLDKIEFVSIEALKQCVVAGLGVALIPRMTIEKELDQGTVSEIIWIGQVRDIYTQLAWHNDKTLTAPLSAFIDMTKKHYGVI